MKKHFLSIVVLLSAFLVQKADAQMVIKGFYLSIPDPGIYVGNASSGAPVFTVPGINTIISGYSVTDFYQAFPSSRYEASRQVYVFSCLDTNLAVELSVNYPQYFYWGHEPVYVGQPTGIPNISGQPEILIYPNPAKGKLSLRSNANVKGICKICITDVLGRTKYQTTSGLMGNTPYELDITSLAGGNYFLSISNSEGYKVQQQFVKL